MKDRLTPEEQAATNEENFWEMYTIADERSQRAYQLKTLKWVLVLVVVGLVIGALITSMYSFPMRAFIKSTNDFLWSRKLGP